MIMEKHFTTTAVLVSDGSPKKILLGLHKKLGVWLPPGGHIDPGETPIDSVIRETMEEAGIDIAEYFVVTSLDERVNSLPIPTYFFEETIPEHNGVPEHKHLDFVYVLSGVPESAFVQNTAEMTDMRWFSADELLGKDSTYALYPNLRDVILRDIFST
jgi:8-oxo-dGTP pyrophosphatase MutT (NUDIX family)